jgi:hypothetical protein
VPRIPSARIATRAWKRDSGPLRNNKHEQFAQLRAQGHTCKVACYGAGYPASSPVNAAYTIDRREDVIRRVAEIRGEYDSAEPIPLRPIQQQLMNACEASIWDFVSIDRATQR